MAPPSTASVWGAADKIVYSTTLADVATERTQLQRSFDCEAVSELVTRSPRDVLVGGPHLAAQALRSGIVDEVLLYVWPVIDLPLTEFDSVVRLLAPRTDGLGLEQVMVQFRESASTGEPLERMLRLSRPPGQGLTLAVTAPPTEPMRELDAYTQKVIRARRRGAVYPYELVPMLLRSPDGGAPGTFTEYDLDEHGVAVAVQRPPGQNKANIVLGVATTPTTRYPEGMTRVVLIGDPTKALGALAEPECARVIAAPIPLDAPVTIAVFPSRAVTTRDSNLAGR